MKDYVELLNQKVQNEFNVFIGEISKQNAAFVVERAYEIVYKEDLMYAIMDKKLNQKSAKLLYLLQNTLECCYQEWLKNDLSNTDLLSETLDEVIRKYGECNKNKERVTR